VTDRLLESAMAGSPILSLLSSASRDRLAVAGSALALEPGRLLCQRGDPGDAIFVVLEGEIEIRVSSPEGREVRFASFGPGAVVGEMAVLDGGLRSTDMLSARRSRLWRIPREPLMEALRGDPGACVALVAELARRLRASNAELEATRVLSLGGRLAQLLLGGPAEKPLVSLTQTEIARRLGASREKVNRKLNAWARQGWVALGPSGVRLLDRAALAEEMLEKGAS
jgi:CRP/FNR family cyclic AMP-dependent transcriptional regulator